TSSRGDGSHCCRCRSNDVNCDNGVRFRDGMQAIEIAPDGDRPGHHLCNTRHRPDRAKILFRIGIRMQSTPVDFDAEQFLDPNVAKMDRAAKMVEKRKLTRFVRRLEEDAFETECLCEAVRKG